MLSLSATKAPVRSPTGSLSDIVLLRTPKRVVADYRAFVGRLRSALPTARLVFVSIKPSPSRRAFIDRMRETNQRIRMEISR